MQEQDSSTQPSSWVRIETRKNKLATLTATSTLEAAFAWQLKVSGFGVIEARAYDSRAHSGLFVRQYQFDPQRRFRLDFAVPSHKFFVEVHGGTFINGRHVRGVGFERDREKFALLTLAGWSGFELTEKTVKDGRGLAWVNTYLKGDTSGRSTAARQSLSIAQPRSPRALAAAGGGGVHGLVRTLRFRRSGNH